MEVTEIKFWENACDHKEDEYIGSIEYYNIQTLSIEKRDIYIFDSHGQTSPHVCIRYGNEPHEYLSPGPLKNFPNIVDGLVDYEKAYELMLEKGIDFNQVMPY